MVYATIVNDRRSVKHRGATSRERFLQRNRNHIRRAVNRSISDGNVTDIGKDGVDVVVPPDDLKEYNFRHGQGGRSERVHNGNDRFTSGDTVPRPEGGGGRGRGDPSADGEGEDDFVFHLSEEEFLKYLFEDLRLPNMVKKGLLDSVKTVLQRAGFIPDGTPNNLDILQSLRRRNARLTSQGAKYNDRIMDILSEQRDILARYEEPREGIASVSGAAQQFEWVPKKKKIQLLETEVSSLREQFAAQMLETDLQRLQELDEELALQQGMIGKIPKWDEMDLKYRNYDPVPLPSSKAVMFCLMDVSGSMDQETKDKAKIFYFLLYKFLKKNYDKVDVVFIRHHSWAEEVDEKEFFYGRATGGTVVSTALQKMLDIIKERYPDEQNWNMYAAQASDGDNVDSDNRVSVSLLNTILTKVQGYFYTEITEGNPQGLWRHYENVRQANSDRFWMGRIKSRKDIWPLFREFFKSRGDADAGASPGRHAQAAFNVA